jgi:hypothetical protein
MRIALILLLSTLLSGCVLAGRNGDNLRDNLANRGPVSLSKSNPYIASNILLTNELASSSILKGFLKVRGNPDAIEVKKVLLRPYTLYFFYLKEKEVYILEEATGDWIIRGPQIIPSGVMEVLQRIVVEVTANQEAQPKSSVELDTSNIIPEQPSEIPEEGSAVFLPPPAPTAPKSEQIQVSEGEDIVHTIQFRGETLRLIAEWYTGNAESAARIARINGLADANSLAMGQTLRIPRYLAKNDKPLTQDKVREYLSRR